MKLEQLTATNKYMSKKLETRIVQLERYLEDSREPLPGLVYISPNQTFEEAAVEYKARHGFDFPEDAPVIKIVAYDGRKKSEAIDENEVAPLDRKVY